MAHADTLLSVAQAAERLGISRRSVYRLIAAGTLRTIKLGGRRLVPPDAIADLIAGALAGDVLADPEIASLLRNVAERDRQRGTICPRCMRGRVNPASTTGWCQPCETEQEERIKASKRRHYHRSREDQ